MVDRVLGRLVFEKCRGRDATLRRPSLPYGKMRQVKPFRTAQRAVPAQ